MAVHTRAALILQHHGTVNAKESRQV